jgi:hypothetical protein
VVESAMTVENRPIVLRKRIRKLAKLLDDIKRDTERNYELMGAEKGLLRAKVERLTKELETFGSLAKLLNEIKWQRELLDKEVQKAMEGKE